jgi:hypothetical protein
VAQDLRKGAKTFNPRVTHHDAGNGGLRVDQVTTTQQKRGPR